MKSIPRNIVASLCRQYGHAIRCSAGLDGVRLMWAISGAESSFGDNCAPRHENAYDRGGYYYLHSNEEKRLVDRYGSIAASSFGPWQVMLVNAPGYTPDELEDNPEKCAQAFVIHMNNFVLDFRKAKTLEEVAQTYNSGNFYPNPSSSVLRYMDAVRHYYDSYPMPDK